MVTGGKGVGGDIDWKTGIQKLDIRLLSEQAAKGFLLPTPFVKR